MKKPTSYKIPATIIISLVVIAFVIIFWPNPKPKNKTIIVSDTTLLKLKFDGVVNGDTLLGWDSVQVSGFYYSQIDSFYPSLKGGDTVYIGGDTTFVKYLKQK